MDSDDLNAFVELSTEGNYGRAARKLHANQSGLSRLVQVFERDFGVQLVERTTRHVKLTDAGRVFVTESSKVLETVEHLQQSMTRFKHQQ